MALIFKGCPIDQWGYIPNFLDEGDPRPVREQFNARYSGGWHPMSGIKMRRVGWILTYPGDPPFQPIGSVNFRDEVVILYQHAIVVVVQKDGSWEAARMD